MTLHARYWCRQALVVTVDGPQGPRTTTVEQPFARLSARKSAEIVLADLRIASRGLYLHATDAGVFCLGFSHAETAEEPWRGWLRQEQAVAFGPYQVSARLAGSPASPGGMAPTLPDLAQKGTAGEPCPIIAVAFGDREIARRRLSRSLTVVGRLRPSALPIHSNDLSASHLVFYWEAGTLWVIDLLSRLGTCLEGIPVQCAELPLGCSLTAGEVRLTFSGLFSSRRAKRAEVPIDLPAEAPGLAGEEPPPEPVAAAAEQEPPSDAEPVERSPTGPAQPSAAEPPWQAELGARQRAFREQQDAWAAQQRQRELEWRERTAEFAERQAALAADQQRQRMALEKERRATQKQIADWTASMERLRADLAGQRSALDAEQEQTRRREQEFDERRAQWEAEESRRLEAACREEELLRAVRAEREALEEQFRQQRASLEHLRAEVERQQVEVERQQAELRLQKAPAAEGTLRADVEEAPGVPPPGTPETVRPVPTVHPLPIERPGLLEQPVPGVAAGPDDSAPPGGKGFDASYDEVLDRLMLVSRRRSSRLQRLREACGGLWKRVSRRWATRPIEEPPDRDAESQTGA